MPVSQTLQFIINPYLRRLNYGKRWESFKEPLKVRRKETITNCNGFKMSTPEDKS